MDEIPQHQLDPKNSFYVIHSLASTSMDPPPISLVNQSGEESQADSNIDWCSFFSDPIKFGEQKSTPTSSRVPITSAGNINGGKNNNIKLGKVGKNKKAIMPRIEFHTRSVDDVLDDGYRWRKYGQKSVKNSAHPRSYYRCTYHTCNVKKQIQRLSRDPSIIVTTYEGIHDHPCEKLLECLSPLLKHLQFLSRI